MLNKNNFMIASLLSNDDEAAATYRTMRVSVDGTQVTNGTALIQVSAPRVQESLFPPTEGIIPAQYWTPFWLDKESSLKIAKAFPKKGGASSQIAAVDATTENNGRATIAINELVRQDVITAEKTEHVKEPKNFAKLIPDKDHASYTVAFDPELLKQVVTIAAQFCASSGARQVVLRFGKLDQPVRIDAGTDEQKLVGAIATQRFVEGAG